MSRPRRITGILFDKDGTLFDFERSWTNWMSSLLRRLARGDERSAEAAGRSIGFDYHGNRFKPDSFVIAGTPAQIFDRLQLEFPDWPSPELHDAIEESSTAAMQAEAVPLKPLLSGMVRTGYRLGIATNDSESVARAHIRDAGVADLFEFVAGSDSGFGAKPDPGMLRAFCAHAGIAPASALYVGDSLLDLEAGRRAGIETVGVLTGMADRKELSPMAAAVLDDIGQLPDWLERRNGTNAQT